MTENDDDGANDPSLKVRNLMDRLFENESRAAALIPKQSSIPKEGQAMFDDLMRLRQEVAIKKLEIEKLREETEKCSADASNVDTIILGIETEQNYSIEQLQKTKDDERAMTERVLLSMRQKMAVEVALVEEKEATISEFEKVALKSLLCFVSDLESLLT
jgi:hypothetical protein